MIKIKLLICLMFVFTLQAFAQKSNLGSQPISERAKMENIKSCPELQQQLTTLFGENFKLDDPKVIAKIQKISPMKKHLHVLEKFIVCSIWRKVF
ncbi:MAG: hypothetical protein IPH46_00745 [Bacteroidetes bacterium]|nr:hypothetical protein [Bacteroidota bacterium]